MSPIIYNINNAVLKEKMASFDFDWTLVCPKDGRTFPKNIEDWEWLYPGIKAKIKSYSDNNYMVVIFTNQSKEWKHSQIKNVMMMLDIPVFIVIATTKDTYKPNPLLLTSLLDSYKINKEESFFVGDALGRNSDHSNCDKMFAENIGVKIYSPEKMFMDVKDIEIHNIPIPDSPEIIIMTGYPGSGKSSIAKKVVSENNNYVWIPRDLYKTPSKMKKEAKLHIAEDKSIIFDATNGSIKSRKVFVDFATNYPNYKVRCVYLTLSLSRSYNRNKAMADEDQVPKIAYNVYKKHFSEPSESEGFSVYRI